MSVFDIVLTAALTLWLVYEIISVARMFMTIVKSSEKVFTWDLRSIVFIIAITVILVLIYRGSLTNMLFIACEVLFIPMTITVFTPQGVVSAMYRPKCDPVIPAQSISYEYRQGKVLKDTLMLYDKGKDSPARCIIAGIHDPKLITMLNENYNKYGFENPMFRS